MASDNEKILIKVKANGDSTANITDYDILYDTNSSTNGINKKIVLTGKNSSIVVNNEYKLLSDKYNFTFSQINILKNIDKSNGVESDYELYKILKSNAENSVDKTFPGILFISSR